MTRPAATAPVFPDDLDTGRYLDLVRALDHQRTLASRAESLIAACALQLARIPWETTGGERQRMIVRLADLIGLAESAALEAVIAGERLAEDIAP